VRISLRTSMSLDVRHRMLDVELSHKTSGEQTLAVYSNKEVTANFTTETKSWGEQTSADAGFEPAGPFGPFIHEVAANYATQFCAGEQTPRETLRALPLSYGALRLRQDSNLRPRP
jgi:hypothetical protein